MVYTLTKRIAKEKARTGKISLDGVVKKDDSVTPEGKKTDKKNADASVPSEEKNEAVSAEMTETATAEAPSVSEENGNETNT